MSGTEIRQREGMAYGGMPHDELLYKLEETDPELIRDVAGNDEYRLPDSAYNEYVRAEIIDRTPDAPAFEYDHARRDPALSRSILNLRYNGTRGSNPELPRHTELFYGFTGNDPRGADTQPRFDVVRGHMNARAAGLTVRMGDNDMNHVAERPWTGQSISYGMKEIHRRRKNTTRIFTEEKEGRPWSRNIDMTVAGGDARARAMARGGESLSDHGDQRERFRGGDFHSAAESHQDGVRGVDGGQRAERAPWRNSVSDMELPVQQYGQQSGAGRSLYGPGSRVKTSGADQQWAQSRESRSANRQSLGRSMAIAAKARKLASSGHQDQEHGQSIAQAAHSGLTPAQDVTRVYFQSREDQTRRPSSSVQDDEGGTLGGSAGLTPAQHPERSIYKSDAAVDSANARLSNITTIVTSLREGSSSDRRRAAGKGLADIPQPGAAENSGGALGSHLAPSADYGKAALRTSMPIAYGAASGLVTQTYSASMPDRPEPKVAISQGAHDTVTWQGSHVAPAFGKSGGLTRRTATQDPTVLGDDSDRTFGPADEVHHNPSAVPTGPKTLRAGSWSETVLLPDPLAHDSMT
jgi:hypothetical protein